MSKQDDRIRKNFDDANMSGANLDDADLDDASMRRSNLEGATLKNAHLAGSDLHGAQLDHADVTGADLHDADLTGASLYDVDLDRAASTEGIHLAGATGVTGHLADDRHDQTLPRHIVQATDDIQRLTAEIVTVARRAALAPAGATGADARREAAARVSDLQERRRLLEDRVLSLLEDGE